MLYRRMKKVATDLSILGFGCMRLPITKDGHINEKQASDMLRYAIDHGVNYIDTAYPYHNGESEPFLERALKDGYREKVNLATKLPSWLIKSRADMDRYLDEQLKRLQADHIDFYLVHGLMRPFWSNLLPLGVTDFLDDAIADGKIRYAGFSFHDELALFKEIVDAYDWTFCQIQYNFMDEQYQAGTEGLKYAWDRGLGIVIMYKKRIQIPCTGCRYCLPCMSNVSIPECFEMYNQGCMFEAPEVAKVNYDIVLGGMLTGGPGFASQCKECGECEEKCPQGVSIRENLKKVVDYFGK